MKLLRRTATLAVTAMLGLGALAATPQLADAAGHHAATPAPHAAVSPRKAAKVYVRDCPGDRYKIAPRQFLIACGDGTVFVQKISWSNWGARRAHGTGTLGENNCIPNCAAGTVHFERTSITLTRLATRHGRRDYGYVTVIPKAPNRYHFRPIRSSLT